MRATKGSLILSVRIIFSFTQSSPFEARYLLARVPGAKKDGGDHLLSTNTQHIARLGREVQPEPAKEGRKGADDLTWGEVWDRGFDSLPWHHRSDAHDSITLRILHQKGGRVPPTRPETG